MPSFPSGIAKLPPGSDSKLGTEKTHFFPCHIPTGNYLRQSLLGTKPQMRSALKYREGGSRQPPLETG